MSLYLITGNSGTGKTAVYRELKTRGYKAIDTDEDGLAKWQHNTTGYIHPKSSIKAHQRTPEFLEQHSWNVPRSDVEEMAKTAQGKTVFLCGVLANEPELTDLFEKVFALYVDDETLKNRLETRTDNDWGKQPHELERVLKWHHYIYDVYRKTGVIIIDATQSIDKVITEIINYTISKD